MSDTKELIVTQPHAIMPVMDVRQAVARRNAIVQFVREIMQPNVHYGKVPGTDKETLLKPGAEMLTTFFGLSPHFLTEEKVQDWTGIDHGGEPFFYFQYRCQLCRGDLSVGEGIGSCNSWEKKYRYRKAALVCPSCGADAISRSRYPPRGAPQGTPNGWWCRDCKTDFALDAPEIANQEQGQVFNPNPADLVNTIDKMAQKRALVAATLIAVNASEFFTQDLEDIIDADFEPAEPESTGTTTTTPAPPASHKTQTRSPRGNGQNTPAQPKAEPVSSDQWDTLKPPADFTELWGGHRFAELGYESMQHAKNAIHLVYPDQKLGTGEDDIDAATAWAALVDHAKSKEGTDVG